MTEIENGAFYFCDSLASVQLPSTLEKVGDSAFYLSPLTEIWYSGSAAEKNEIDVGAWSNDAWHSAAWHYVDSTCDPDCNDCGKKRDVSCRFVHYYDDNQHWMQCYLCGAEMTHFDHVFDSDGITCIACPYKKYIPGDVDGSDEVDMDDAIYLLFHCSFAEEYPVNQPVYFDGLGEVDMDDAIYLLFYCSFPDEYPLS